MRLDVAITRGSLAGGLALVAPALIWAAACKPELAAAFVMAAPILVLFFWSLTRPIEDVLIVYLVVYVLADTLKRVAGGSVRPWHLAVVGGMFLSGVAASENIFTGFLLAWCVFVPCESEETSPELPDAHGKEPGPELGIGRT